MVKFCKIFQPLSFDSKFTLTQIFQNEFPKAVARRCPVKMVFLKISHNSQENTYVEASFLIMLQAFVVPLKVLRKL